MDVEAYLKSDGLFRTDFPGVGSFLWRLLTLKEYNKFRILRDAHAMHPLILYSLVFEKCYIGDVKLLHKDIPAGIPVCIGECIMWLSGDNEGDSLANDIEMARAHYPLDGVKEYMKRIIYTAFPSYTEEDADSWTYPQLVKKFVISEGILINRGLEYQPLDTRKFARNGEQAKRQGVVDFKDLQKENRDMNDALGQREHPLDMDPVEFARMKKRNEGRLSRSTARALDRMHAR